MADVLQVLTSSSDRTPAAATNYQLYVVLPGTAVMVSHLLVCNTSATATAFRVFIVKSGESAGLDTAIAYDVPIAGNDTVPVPVNGGLAAGDSIYVYNTLATCTFTPFGIVVTA